MKDMDDGVRKRIESALRGSLEELLTEDCPRRLREAISYAVFPGGARLRPRLCLAVAEACGATDPELGSGVAAAIEMLHCASLVHDDLPCFDNAMERRGRPSVHALYGEATAVLVGDALIVGAFHTAQRACASHPHLLPQVISLLTAAIGVPHGLVAGQAWEAEDDVEVQRYHKAKTATLYAAACVAGAITAGVDGEPWREAGTLLGLLYQVIDDLSDVDGAPAKLGKPVGKDAALGRPSAVSKLGHERALRRAMELRAAIPEAIPPCPGEIPLRRWCVGRIDEMFSVLPALGGGLTRTVVERSPRSGEEAVK
jgi:geranylgeranyl diphosphate synthase, type II